MRKRLYATVKLSKEEPVVIYGGLVSSADFNNSAEIQYIPLTEQWSGLNIVSTDPTDPRNIQYPSCTASPGDLRISGAVFFGTALTGGQSCTFTLVADGTPTAAVFTVTSADNDGLGNAYKSVALTSFNFGDSRTLAWKCDHSAGWGGYPFCLVSTFVS